MLFSVIIPPNTGQILCAGTGQCGLPWSPGGLPLPPVAYRGLQLTTRRTRYIVRTFQIRHWDQNSNVPVYRPSTHLSARAQTFLPCDQNRQDFSHRLRGSRAQKERLSNTHAWICSLCNIIFYLSKRHLGVTLRVFGLFSKLSKHMFKHVRTYTI